MNSDSHKRYKIGEVSEATGVPVHVLRDWERRFRELNPRRDRANRRYYLDDDIRVVRRLKEMLWRDGMTTEGVKKQFALERHGVAPPRTTAAMVDLLDQLDRDIRKAIQALDSVS